MKNKLLLKYKIGFIPTFSIPIKGLAKAKVKAKNGWIYYFQGK